LIGDEVGRHARKEMGCPKGLATGLGLDLLEGVGHVFYLDLVGGPEAIPLIIGEKVQDGHDYDEKDRDDPMGEQVLFRHAAQRYSAIFGLWKCMRFCRRWVGFGGGWGGRWRGF
jgi:hypothetical protein